MEQKSRDAIISIIDDACKKLSVGAIDVKRRMTEPYNSKAEEAKLWEAKQRIRMAYECLMKLRFGVMSDMTGAEMLKEWHYIDMLLEKYCPKKDKPESD